MTRHPLAAGYEQRATGRVSGSLRELALGAPIELDAAGVREAFGESPASGRTICRGVRRLPTRLASSPEAPHGSLGECLAAALAELPGERVALAVSGGVDSASLWAALRGRARAFTIATGLSGYCELELTRGLARELGEPLEVVELTADEIVEATPAAVRAAETPLYNLHPVTRALLAARVRAAGYDVLVTGDGADQVARGELGEDYLPIVGALTRSAGLLPVAPFLDERVRAATPLDPSKRALRELAVALGAPRAHVAAPKVARLMPPLPGTSRLLDLRRAEELATQLGRPLEPLEDRGLTCWATLGLLIESWEPRACAA